MNKKILLLIFLLMAITPIVNAAPAIDGIAINEQTKECAGYWAGDEFTEYQLPSGWKSYYPNYDEVKEGKCIEGTGQCEGGYQCVVNGEALSQCYTIKDNCTYSDECMYKSVPIITEKGRCDFNRLEEESCCTQLGYTYISDNIGKGQETSLEFQKLLFGPIAVMSVLVILILVVLFFTIKYLIKKNQTKSNK